MTGLSSLTLFSFATYGSFSSISAEFLPPRMDS